MRVLGDGWLPAHSISVSSAASTLVRALALSLSLSLSLSLLRIVHKLVPRACIDCRPPRLRLPFHRSANWELVVQMMLAIRLSVGAARARGEREDLSDASHNGSGAAAAKRRPRGSGSQQQQQQTVGVTKAQPPVPPAAAQGASASSAAGGPAPPALRESSSMGFELQRSHFDDAFKFDLPGHSRGRDIKIGFKDYAPLAFRRIRQLFGISDTEYMLSLGPEQILGELLLGTMGSLSELFSEGKSGSFFYFSNDGRYLIKTIPHRELTSLIRLLPQYVAHVEAEPQTLLPRFMGAHRLSLPDNRRKVHFMVMTNVFATPRIIHHRYDLKGSTHGRTAGAKTLEAQPETVRKDLDVRVPFKLKPGARDALMSQLAKDLHFLRTVYTMDYSLLVGVHFPNRDQLDDASLASLAVSQVAVHVDGHAPGVAQNGGGGGGGSKVSGTTPSAPPASPRANAPLGPRTPTSSTTPTVAVGVSAGSASSLGGSGSVSSGAGAEASSAEAQGAGSPGGGQRGEPGQARPVCGQRNDRQARARHAPVGGLRRRCHRRGGQLGR